MTVSELYENIEYDVDVMIHKLAIHDDVAMWDVIAIDSRDCNKAYGMTDGIRDAEIEWFYVKKSGVEIGLK